jgi:hypothetical protein
LDYDALHRWSVEHPERFWRAVWRFSGVIADARPDGEAWETVLTGGSRMAPPDPVLGPRWFTGARLNFAEQLLRRRDDGEALVAWNEEGRQGAMTFAELARQVQRAAGALRAQGVGPGDRVAAFLPNIPEAVVAMLAATSLGAIWSSCSPDFGVNGVLDRFGQIAPRVLVACDGYRYAGKSIDTRARVADIAAQIPGIERWSSPYLREAEPMEGSRRLLVGGVACGWRRVARESCGGRRAGLHATPVRSSVVHHVFVRHHRPPQVHGARGWGDAPAAPQGAPAARRRRAARPCRLRPYLRVDDVDLAGERAGGGATVVPAMARRWSLGRRVREAGDGDASRDALVSTLVHLDPL